MIIKHSEEGQTRRRLECVVCRQGKRAQDFTREHDGNLSTPNTCNACHYEWVAHPGGDC